MLSSQVRDQNEGYSISPSDQPFTFFLTLKLVSMQSFLILFAIFEELPF